MLANWTASAKAFVALRAARDAAAADARPWAWRWVALDADEPLAGTFEGYLVWDRHFRASAAAVAAAAPSEDAAEAPRPPPLDEWEYHLLPSTTYDAPELRFRAARGDGAPLTLAEIKSALPDLPVASRAGAVVGRGGAAGFVSRAARRP